MFFDTVCSHYKYAIGDNVKVSLYLKYQYNQCRLFIFSIGWDVEIESYTECWSSEFVIRRDYPCSVFGYHCVKNSNYCVMFL